MKTKQQVIMSVLALCMLGCLSVTAQADPLTLTLTNANQTGAVGSVLTFGGNVLNGVGNVTITGNSFSIVPPGNTVLTLDDSPFVVSFLDQTLGSGGMLSGDFFTITIGAGATPGTTFTGVFSVLFDGVMGAGQESNFQTFSVTVQQSPDAIPEPATLILLGTGLVGVATKFKRRAAKRGGERPTVSL